MEAVTARGFVGTLVGTLTDVVRTLSLLQLYRRIHVARYLQRTKGRMRAWR